MMKYSKLRLAIKYRSRNGYCVVCFRRINLKKNGLVGDHVSYREPWGCSGSFRSVLPHTPTNLPNPGFKRKGGKAT